MVNKVMGYFFLVFGNMGLRILTKLIESGKSPGLIVSHKTYNYETSREGFYEPLRKLAEDNNIEIIFTDKISEEKEKIKQFSTGICCGFMEILRQEIYELPENGIFNLHCGKLPQYRGRAPISRSIMNGEKELTVSLHKIDSGVDSGDILLTELIEITDSDDVNTMYEKCIPVSYKLISEALEIINSDELNSRLKPQENTESKANKSITDAERKIKPDSEIKEVYNLVRALYPPYPGATFVYNGKLYKIESSRYEYDKNSKGGGMIKFAGENEIAIEFKGGRLITDKISEGNKLIENIREIFIEGEYIE